MTVLITVSTEIARRLLISAFSIDLSRSVGSRSEGALAWRGLLASFSAADWLSRGYAVAALVSQKTYRRRLWAMLASPILVRALAMPMVRTNSPMRCF